MKHRIWLLALVSCAAVLFQGCGSNPTATVQDYLSSLKAGKFEHAASLTTDSTSQLINKDEPGTKVAVALVSQMSYKVGAAKITGDEAIVDVELTVPDMERVTAAVMAEMLPLVMAAAFSGSQEKVGEAVLEEKLLTAVHDSNVPMTTTHESISVKRVGGKWLVVTDVIGSLGPGSQSSPAGMTATIVEIDQLQREIEELQGKKAASEKVRADLQKFAVERSLFYYSTDSFLTEPVIELSVRNGTPFPVARAYFHGILSTPGRAIPWVDEDFNYSIRGGLEPGETATWKLSPNMFGPWGNAPEDRHDMILKVSVVRLDGADGKPLYDGRFSDYDRQRLDDLAKRVEELKAKLGSGGKK